MSLEVTVHDYKRSIGREFREWLLVQSKALLTANKKLKKVSFYDFAGEKQHHAGSTSEGSKSLLVFMDSTHDSVTSDGIFESTTINGLANNVVRYHELQGSGVPILSAEGYPIAEYLVDSMALNILIDVQTIPFETAKEILTFILKAVNEEDDKENQKFSWIMAPSRDWIIAEVKKHAVRDNESLLKDSREKERQHLEHIENFKQELASRVKKLAHVMRDIERLTHDVASVGDKFFKDLDLIAGLPNIRDIRYEEGLLSVFVDSIYAYDDDGKRYYIGNFRIEMNMSNTDVRFYGDNPRKSYWTSQDPAPHVSGASGKACLGNVSSTIAELCAQQEIYALTLICIDFLQAANLEDSAGRYVKNWDEVDEEGNVIHAGGSTNMCSSCGDNESTHTCHETGDRICGECIRAAINDEGDTVIISVSYIENHSTYRWNEDRETYVHRDFVDEEPDDEEPEEEPTPEGVDIF